ncbi:MAG: hypothetical protein Q9214_007520, partial [Letrouitia sp. 1 TL-2023]
TLATSLNLAVLYKLSKNRDKREMAAKLFKDTLNRQKRVLGETHEHVFRCADHLGELYGEDRKYADAEEFYRFLAIHRESVLGPEHPDVLQSKLKLAACLSFQDREKEATPLIECYSAAKSRFGEGSEEALQGLEYLAQAYFREQRWEEGMVVNESIVDKGSQALGYDHPIVERATAQLEFRDMEIRSLALWPPANGLTTVLVPRNETTFSISASANINAPAPFVFNVIRNTTAYPDWNTFTPAANITSRSSNSSNSSPQDNSTTAGLLALGDRFTYTVVLDPTQSQNTTQSFERVTDYSTPDAPSSYVPPLLLEEDGSFYPNLSRVYRIAWGVSNPATPGQLVTERFSEVIDLGNRTSEYRTWENLGGSLASVVQELLQGTLQRRFEDYARDLKGE